MVGLATGYVPAVLHNRPLRRQKHDIANNSKGTPDQHDWATGFESVGQLSSDEDGEETCHVGWHGEELRCYAFVTETGDDGGEEEREGINTALLSWFLMGIDALAYGVIMAKKLRLSSIVLMLKIAIRT